ncbi:MAG: SLC13 family permease [Caldilineaceae bacterium]|nr:SLC13 family permease [Caldilineaceae bacterium]
MSLEIVLLLVILISATLLYITRWLAMEVTATLTIIALVITGLLRPEQAFSGFSNSATLTVAAMFVLSGGLMRTGALEMITFQLSRFSHGSTLRLLLLLAAIVPLASAFVNNTPVVVMMVPVIISLSHQFGQSPSKLLMPLSYFAILGGTLTLLGTSTNILVDGIYRQAGGAGFGIFEFAPLGMIYAAIGTIYIVFTSQRILPDRQVISFAVQQRKASYVTELLVDEESDLIDKRAGDVVDRVGVDSRKQPMHMLISQRRRLSRPSSANEDAQESTVELLEIFREERIYRGEEAANLHLLAGDVLLIAGLPNNISQFMKSTNTQLASVLVDDQRVPIGSLEQKVVEAVVLPESPFVGRPLGSIGLYRTYGVTVMGVQRQGRQRMRGLRSLPLQSGDVILLQGQSGGLDQLRETGRLLLVEGIDQTIVRSTKNRQAILIMLGVVLVATLSEIPIVILALVGAVLMILTRCLRTDEAMRSLDTPTLFLLAGTIPLGLAMESTGLAAQIVQGVLAVTGGADPRIFLSIFYLLTSLLTELISNNAVAVLLTPIALQLAVTLGIDPKPLLIAIAFGASASFMTPMGYQTNAIVMGPGGYNFRDYLKFGMPLNLLMWITATIMIPLLWPL